MLARIHTNRFNGVIIVTLNGAQRISVKYRRKPVLSSSQYRNTINGSLIKENFVRIHIRFL